MMAGPGFDVGNMQMLRAGANAEMSMANVADWRPIASAPRDGTIIEVRCTYGVAPWYGLYHWVSGPEEVEALSLDADGTTKSHKVIVTREPHWAKVGEPSLGFSEGPTFTWRPYQGNATQYIDPTGGAQDSPAYWRGAVAQKYGLPLDYFEKETARNIGQSKPWWKFW